MILNKLSIIITYFNSEEYIEDCINSLKTQRNQDFEIIIVDDGSTDHSTQILNKTLASYDKDVTFIQLETNTGHAHARNIALDLAKGQYVMFLDADDQLASYAIEYYLNHINGLDTLIAPVHKFTMQRPQYVDKDKIRLQIDHIIHILIQFYEKKLHVIFYLEMQLLKHMTLNLMKI